MKLIITVQFLCGRYHGRNREKALEDFPLSPMRFFQALIAASHRGIYGKQNVVVRDDALRWLENLAPPIIVAGETLDAGEDTINFVPNNDDKLNHVRTDKSLHHRVLLGDGKVRFVWDFEGESNLNHAKTVCAMTRLVTYLGQTTDLVTAHGEIGEDFAADGQDTIYEPRETKNGDWQVPDAGTLENCQERYANRLNTSSGFPISTRWVNYQNRNALYLNAPTVLFRLRIDGKSEEAVLLQRISAMTRHAFLKFLEKNKNFETEYGADLLAQTFAGHESSVSTQPLDAPHVAFVPIPSLSEDGLADGKIRRVLVIGYGCENSAERAMFYDIADKLNGEFLFDERRGLPLGELEKVEKPKTESVARLFFGNNRRVWRTVTPIILSGHTRLIDSVENPANEKTKIFKKGRAPEDLIIKALIEAGIPLGTIESVSASKSPLVPKTKHAFDYKPNVRLSNFPRYHAEIIFKTSVTGTLVVGRGRFAGFGLLMPWR